ncbi:hypothetical protein CCR75_007895 [Bremia lactucae]|uniref:Uncharacterized protein n=1 Tax=Bremia lactucae TaxID=4779 RepID=A0A976FI56_BRELC|nr:hypothetical protein CCR75_007895 [Bremia lactucae]
MNSLLFLYLNFVRGPKIVAARRAKEEEEKRAQLKADIASGKVPRVASCKKCDVLVDRLAVPMGIMPTCVACLAKESQELYIPQVDVQRKIAMSPFLWFQIFIMLLGLTVFIHRNVVSLF